MYERASHYYHRVMESLALSGQALTLEEIAAVATNGRKVTVAGEAWPKIEASRRVVESLIKCGETAYGINTGFGKLADVRISNGDLKALQRNLVLSHASGIGEPLPAPETRAMLLLRANVLAKGYSGVRPVVLEALVAMLNKHIHPIIPMRGSVGASGDLAPLAHLSLALIGEGEAWHAGERLPSAEALKRAGLAPITLGAKEGLALINGTHVMEACGALAVVDAWRLVRAAEV